MSYAIRIPGRPGLAAVARHAEEGEAYAAAVGLLARGAYERLDVVGPDGATAKLRRVARGGRDARARAIEHDVIRNDGPPRPAMGRAKP